MKVRIKEFSQEAINRELRGAEENGFVLVDHEILPQENKMVLFFQEVTE